jgi:hypothetical protein
MPLLANNKKLLMKKIFFVLTLLPIALAAFSQSHPTEAWRVNTDSLFQKIRQEKNDDRRMDIILDFFSYTSDIDPLTDMKNSQLLLSEARNNKDLFAEALALSQIAYNYRNFGNSAKSLSYGLESTAMAIKTGNSKLIANCQLNLAHNYKDITDYSRAIPMYWETATHGSAIKDDLIQLWSFNSLAQIYNEMNQLDSSLMYSQRSYELAIRYDTNFLSTIYKNLGSIHGKMKNPVLASGYFEMSVAEAKKLGSARYLNETYTNMALYYYSIDKIDSSLACAKKAIAAVTNTPFSNKTIKPAKLLLDFYQNTNSDSAIKFFKLYRAANDSVFSAQTIQQAQIVSFEDQLRRDQIAAEKTEAAEQRKKNIQYVLISIGILTLIILYLLLSRSFITDERLIEFFGIIALLIVFEFLNLLLHPLLENITNHSPIIMLLALVCIAGLLVPLHHRVEKWATARLVEKNKKIRLASARKTIEKLDRGKLS